MSSEGTPKTILDLQTLGLSEELVESWIAHFNGRSGEDRSDYQLTEFQAEALAHPATCGTARNLLVTGPTSAGKTLIAETIIAKTLTEKPSAKIVYLIPLRALVTEKWEEFASMFPKLRDRIVAASSDYPGNDRQLTAGNWSIAIVVFEKFSRWMSNRRMIRMLRTNLELVVVDELQILEHPERGEKLEVILSYLRCLQLDRKQNQKPRLVLLATSKAAALPISKWLDAVVVPDRDVSRPVPLYQGLVLPREQAHRRKVILYREGSGEELHQIAVDEYPPSVAELHLDNVSGENNREILREVTVRAISRGRRVLIYVASARDVREIAREIAASLASLPQRRHRSETTRQLDDLEESEVVRILRDTLPRSVGFHYGDMLPQERQVVEHLFRAPSDDLCIEVVVATPTLNMGVNLPADVVIMRDQHTFSPRRLKKTKKFAVSRRPLTILEYRNFAGRAGRLNVARRRESDGPPFGLCLLLLESKKQKVAQRLLNDPVEPLGSSLSDSWFGLEPHILTWLMAAKETWSERPPLDAVERLIMCTYFWSCSTEPKRDAFRHKVVAAIQSLKKLELLTDHGLTLAGEAVAGHHFSATTMGRLMIVAEELEEYWPRRKLELLCLLAGLGEAMGVYPTTQDLLGEDVPIDRHALGNRLRRFLQDLDPETEGFYRADSVFARFLIADDESGLVSDEQLLEMTRAAAAWSWASGKALQPLRDAFPSFSLVKGRALGDFMARSLAAARSLRSMSKSVDPDDESEKDLSSQLWLFEQSLRSGLRPEVAALQVTLAGLPGVGMQLPRKTYFDMWRAVGGWRDPQSLYGLERPASVLPNTWLAVQKAIEAVQSSDVASADKEDVAQEDGLLRMALNGLAGGGFTRVVSEPSPEWLTRIGHSQTSYDRLLAVVTTTVAGKELGAVAHQAFQRLGLHPASNSFGRGDPVDPVWWLSFGDDVPPAYVILVGSTPDPRKARRIFRGPNRKIIVCSEGETVEAFDEPALTRGGGSDGQVGEFLVISLEALVAASLEVRREPAHQLGAHVMLTSHEKIASVEEALTSIGVAMERRKVGRQ